MTERDGPGFQAGLPFDLAGEGVGDAAQSWIHEGFERVCGAGSRSGKSEPSAVTMIP